MPDYCGKTSIYTPPRGKARPRYHRVTMLHVIRKERANRAQIRSYVLQMVYRHGMEPKAARELLGAD